jgi:hypothetical protein
MAVPEPYLSMKDAEDILGRLRNLAADAGTGLFNADDWHALVARMADTYELIVYLDEFVASYRRSLDG